MSVRAALEILETETQLNFCFTSPGAFLRQDDGSFRHQIIDSLHLITLTESKSSLTLFLHKHFGSEGFEGAFLKSSILPPSGPILSENKKKGLGFVQFGFQQLPESNEMPSSVIYKNNLLPNCT